MSDADTIAVKGGSQGGGRPRPAQETARAAFPGEFHAAWEKACRRLDGAGYGGTVAQDYALLSPEVARLAGPRQAIDMAAIVSGVAIRGGRRAAALLPGRRSPRPGGCATNSAAGWV